MTGVLDIVALRSLTSIVDAGGFRRAAENLHLSQSAVSQHVRRLEQACGRQLVERNGRAARLTADGDLLVADARRILAIHDDALHQLGARSSSTEDLVIGATEHAADVLLPEITDTLSIGFPSRGVRYRIDRGARLSDRILDGTVDAALLIGAASDRDTAAGSLPLAWYSAPGWQQRGPGTALPLVVIDGACTIRRRAVDALAAGGVDAETVCEAGHLAGVLNATRAGLGVALLATVGADPQGLQRLPGLPQVAPEPMHVRARTGSPSRLAPVLAEGVRRTLDEAVSAPGDQAAAAKGS